jgi:glutamate racemase
VIGVFDSGYGGLNILKDLRVELPQVDFFYLGDNARSPYGSRSFETVFRYTWQGVQQLFEWGCPLVILACNTSSARALRNIQQNMLPIHAPDRRVLGVLRPAVEQIGHYTESGHVGILATEGTVKSKSYELESMKFFPELKVTTLACPMLVPLVENREWNGTGVEYFVQRYIGQLLEADPQIDTVLLGCTHYPYLLPLFKKFFPKNIKILGQGGLVAPSLRDYLRRHPEMNDRLSFNGKTQFATTELSDHFRSMAEMTIGSVGDIVHLPW